MSHTTPPPSDPTAGAAPVAPSHSGHGSAIISALVVTVLWSSSWVLIRWGLDDEALPPLTFAGLRYGTAALVLLGWVLGNEGRRREAATLERRDLAVLAGLGVVIIAITQGAQFVAIDNQPAATTSLVLSLTPLIVAAASMRTLGEPPTAAQVGGAAFVVVGAWCYFAGDLGATAVGLGAAIVGLSANSAGALLGREVNRRQRTSAVVVTTVSMCAGALVLLSVGLAVEGWPSVSGRAALIVGWLAVVNTALAFTLWNWSLRRLTAVEAAGINNTMLIQIALLAWWLLDESPGVAGTIGLVIVSAGIVTIQLAGRR